ncbi:MAG: 2-keto-4-pentenoate hydratase [Proteobacteria bacterium]|nr:2-keto-4-pentenoate hydratase [Pseudomonadota bacterium]
MIKKRREQGPLSDSVARQFVEARLSGRALAAFPGVLPPDLATGYRYQDAAIALFPDEIVGWKIGRVGPEFEARFGPGRLAGPIFRRQLRHADGLTPFPVFAGGFAAIEAEFVFELGSDAPRDKKSWTREQAATLIGALHIGIETAGSPLATINALGPAVVVSDFGNNAGLILGPKIANWRAIPETEMVCESFIDGISVGKGAASDLPGGPIEALRFLAEHCAAHGRPLTKGLLISTGAATGIHDIAIGQRGKVDFGALGAIECIATAAA